jgi:hypothetical protein
MRLIAAGLSPITENTAAAQANNIRAAITI